VSTREILPLDLPVVAPGRPPVEVVPRPPAPESIDVATEPMTPGHGMMINHTATVLLFDRGGKLAGTIATDDPDAAALAKLKRLTA